MTQCQYNKGNILFQLGVFRFVHRFQPFCGSPFLKDGQMLEPAVVLRPMPVLHALGDGDALTGQQFLRFFAASTDDKPPAVTPANTAVTINIRPSLFINFIFGSSIFHLNNFFQTIMPFSQATFLSILQQAHIMFFLPLLPYRL